MNNNVNPNNHQTFKFSTENRIWGYDELFHLNEMQWSDEYPLIIMIWGPEGSGKSTLALELSCLGKAINLSSNNNIHSRCVLYYVTDCIAEPRIETKYTAFNLARHFNDDHRVWFKYGDICPDYVELLGTTIWVRAYTGAPNICDLTQYIKDDINALKKAFETDLIKELVIVVDGIASIESSTEEDLVNRIWADIVIPSKITDNTKIPIIVILVDESHQSTHGNMNIDRNPYLAHLYIRLWQGDNQDMTKEGGYCERYLQIVKASSCSHARGPQIFRIQDKVGIEIHPSLSVYSSIHHNATANLPYKYASPSIYGHDGIDSIIREQFCIDQQSSTIPPGSCNLLIGEAGTFKTPLSLYFSAEAARLGGKAIIFSFHDSSDTIEGFMKSLKGIEESTHKLKIRGRSYSENIQFDDVKPDDQIVIQQMTTWFIPPEVFVSMVRRLIKKMCMKNDMAHPHRIVFDGVSDFQMSYPRLTGKKGFLAVLVNTLRVYGLTSLFLFNETIPESAEDKIILNLADNIFHLYKKSFGGKPSTILHIEQYANRFSGYKGIVNVSRIQDSQIKKEEILIHKSSEAYRLDEKNQLMPVSLKLYVNKWTPNQHSFNEKICKAHGLSDNQLDQELAKQRGEAYIQNIENLISTENRAVIMAVDEDTLLPEILQKFVPLQHWAKELKIPHGQLNKISNNTWIYEEKECSEESSINEGFCYLGANEGCIRVLPSLIDCTVFTCNTQILDELSNADNLAIRTMIKLIDQSKDILRHYDVAKETNSDASDLLPAIPWQLIKMAFSEYSNSLGDKQYSFMGFNPYEDLESLVVLFLDTITMFGGCGNQKIGSKRQFTIDDRAIIPMAHILTDIVQYCRKYISVYYHENVLVKSDSDIVKSENELMKSEIESTKKCLFYYTWHSMLYPCGSSHIIPFKLISLTNDDWKTFKSSIKKSDAKSNIPKIHIQHKWNSTRGGYCWGILNNGLENEMAQHVLQYASNDTMNLFRIKERIGMPPRVKFYVNTGELSIYNLGLMRCIFINAWTRRNIPMYHGVASYVRAFLSEYLSYIHRISSDQFPKKEIYEWLTRFIKVLIKHINNIK